MLSVTKQCCYNYFKDMSNRQTNNSSLPTTHLATIQPNIERHTPCMGPSVFVGIGSIMRLVSLGHNKMRALISTVLNQMWSQINDTYFVVNILRHRLIYLTNNNAITRFPRCTHYPTLSVMLIKLTLRQYPSIHSNYSVSNGTVLCRHIVKPN